jgi:arylsulfatase
VAPQVGHVIDLMSTCLDAAGAAYPKEHKGKAITPTPGQSLVPAFSGKAFRRANPLFWEHVGNRAVRDGDWKMVARNKGPWELYNLAADRTELSELSKLEPKRVAQMTALYDNWAKRCGVFTDEELKQKRGKR